MKGTSGDCRKRKKVAVEECDMKKEDTNVADGVDYMSLLPEHMLHHIIAYMSPKEAARACVLSKRWRKARDASYKVVFDHKCFKGQPINAFQKYVNDFFLRRVEHKCDIQIFNLVMKCGSASSSDVTRWLGVAVNNNVKELDVECSNNRFHFTIPSFVLAAETLTAISVNSCKFGVIDGIKLPNLKKLWLKRMKLTDATLQQLTSGCPSIKSLRLISCKGLVNLRISNLEYLNEFQVHYCNGIRKLEIVADKLESFWFYGNIFRPVTGIDVVGCPQLKKLTLRNPCMDDLSFESLILKFPYLEHLDLSECNVLTNVMISHAQLKSLVLRKCPNLIGGNFHVHQIRSLEYSGLYTNILPLFNLSSLCNVKLFFQSNIDDTVAIDGKMLQFLSSIDQSSGLVLIMRLKKKIAVYQHWKKSYVLSMMLPNMIFEIIKPVKKFDKLLDQLIETHQPEQLSLVADAEWQKILSDKVINRVDNKDELTCCTYRRKCWRHYLKSISIEKYKPMVDINDELIKLINAVEGDELPTITMNLAWESQTS